MHKDAWISALIAPFFWELLRWLTGLARKAVDDYRERNGGPPGSLRNRILRALTYQLWR